MKIEEQIIIVCCLYGGLVAFKIAVRIVGYILSRISANAVALKEKREDRAYVGRFWRKTAIQAVGLICASVLLISVVSCARINSDLEGILAKDVDRCTQYQINRMDERIAKQGIVGKLLLRNLDEYAALKQENERLIDDEAARMIDGIDNLESLEALKSYEHLVQIRAEIDNLKLYNAWYAENEDNDYNAELERRVTNYSRLLEYEAAYEVLVEECREECEACGHGTIVYECRKCDGNRTINAGFGAQEAICEDCRGFGRVFVECTNCTQGYIYHFE